jgi:hypothetical protein
MLIIRTLVAGALAICSLVAVPVAAAATSWRGAADQIQIGLRISHGVVHGEMSIGGCAAPPFLSSSLAPTRLVHGRLRIDRMGTYRGSPDGYRLSMRRTGNRYTGAAELLTQGCGQRNHRFVLRQVEALPASGYWDGMTDQQAKVRFWVSPFGTYIREPSESSLATPTIIADCGPGADRKTIRPWATHISLAPDGSFVVPNGRHSPPAGDATHGTFGGRLVGDRASGTARYTPESCDSGAVNWAASRTG